MKLIFYILCAGSTLSNSYSMSIQEAQNVLVKAVEIQYKKLHDMASHGDLQVKEALREFKRVTTSGNKGVLVNPLVIKILADAQLVKTKAGVWGDNSLYSGFAFIPSKIRLALQNNSEAMNVWEVYPSWHYGFVNASTLRVYNGCKYLYDAACRGDIGAAQLLCTFHKMVRDPSKYILHGDYERLYEIGLGEIEINPQGWIYKNRCHRKRGAISQDTRESIYEIYYALDGWYSTNYVYYDTNVYEKK